MKKNILYIFILISSLLFISRFVVFVATQDVGIEHDSGWYLSVVRNVAQKGIYASSVNTIGTSEKTGDHPSIHNRFSVQDKEGYSYFPAGVTVGPGFILTEALIVKLFGAGWVQYRTWSFVCFFLLITLLFYITYSLGGIVGLIFFQIWLWFYPQIWINQSFEAFSEQIALLYLLSGLILISIKKPSMLMIVCGGLLIGLSIQTKNLFLLPAPLIVILFFLIKKNVKLTFFLLLSIAVPTVLFEAYRFFYLISRFGMSSYLAINKDVYLTMKTGGSGLSIFSRKEPLLFILNKLAVWKHVGSSLLLILIPFAFLKKTYGSLPPLFLYLCASCASVFGWYIALSQTGWFRHAFPAVVMGMMIVPSLYFRAVEYFWQKKITSILVVLLGIFFILLLTVVTNSLAHGDFFLTRKLFYSDKSIPVNSLQGPLFVPVFSRADQDSISTFISRSVPKEKRLCYEGWFLVAELPVIMNRIIFPLPRCTSGDLLVIGPYQRGIYSLVGESAYSVSMVKSKCNKTVYKNDSYLLCKIK
ncbi:MAG: hypothetical protein WAV30_01350 [Microgenomates group bacterium]